MTNPDLNLIERQLMAAVKGIDADKNLSSRFSDSEDFGRQFSMQEALEHAARSLHEVGNAEELAIMDRAFAKFDIKRESSDKGKIAKQLLKHLLRPSA